MALFLQDYFAANTVIDALSPDGQEPEGAEARAFMGQALAARAYGYLYLSQLFVNDPSPPMQTNWYFLSIRTHKHRMC